MMVISLKLIGTSVWCKESLKMSANTLAIWSAQDLSAHPGAPSGPVAFHELAFEKAALASVMVTSDTGSSEASGMEGVLTLNSCSERA